MVANFYEKLDDIFDEYFNDNNMSEQFIKLKSDIIKAYKDAECNKGNYLHKMMKVKHFKITDDGQVVAM